MPDRKINVVVLGQGLVMEMVYEFLNRERGMRIVRLLPDPGCLLLDVLAGELFPVDLIIVEAAPAQAGAAVLALERYPRLQILMINLRTHAATLLSGATRPVPLISDITQLILRHRSGSEAAFQEKESERI